MYVCDFDCNKMFSHDLSLKLILARARISLGIGIVAALLVGLANSLVSIPSQVITTLKYRTGVFESLRDPKFKSFRVGMLQTTYLFGASIWGTIFNILLVFAFVTIGVFLSGELITTYFRDDKIFHMV